MTRRRSGRRRMSVLTLPLTVLMFFLASAAAADAQTLGGRVTDPDGRAVPGASVMVLHGTALATTTTTDGAGRFGPIELPAGDYGVSVAAAGLGAPPTRVHLDTGEARDVNVALTPRAVQESVVVSAAQVELPLSRATDSVTVIDRAELQTTQTHTVADALRLVPGFGLAASGGPGAVTSIFPRGGESDYTLVLVDGIPQNAFGGGFDAAHLDAAGVERIEVVRGPQSALFGSGAIGGLVQLVTRQGGPLRAQAAVEGGGYGFTRSTASASGASGAWRWGGAFDRLTSDGDTRVRANLGRGVANDDYDRVQGSGSLGWSDRPSRVIRVDVHGDRDERGNPGPYGSDPAGLYSGLDLVSRGRNRSAGVAGSATFARGLRSRHHLQATWSDAKARYASPFGPSSDQTRRVTGRYQFDLELRHTGLSAGWELLRERADNTYITGAAGDAIPIARLDSGLFVEARPALGSRVLVTAGARLERLARDAVEESPGTRPAMDEDVVWSLNPKVSAAWFVRGAEAANWTRLRAGAGTGIKPPSAFDIAYTDNPSLAPERSRSVDAGIEQAIGGPSLVAEVTWFLNRYDDLIVTVGSALTGFSRYRTDNIANARAQGLETGVRWRVSRQLAVRGGWTWLDTEVLGVDRGPSVAPPPFAVGEPLVRRPRHQGFGEAIWTHERATAFVTVGGRGRMSDLEPNYAATLVTNPGYVNTTFGGSVAVGRLEVFGRVTNAFDRQYEEVFGFPALGRRASLGVRVAAGR
jgi:outer membrane cobalamin receptor